MKIGLVRHFKVQKDLPKGKMATPADLKKWFDEYDVADIEYMKCDLGNIEWKQCYSSTLPRAVKTAQHIYQGEIIHLDDLCEIPAPTFNGKIKLPFLFWAIGVRFFAYLKKDTRSDIRKTKEKIKRVFDEIIKSGEEDVLIVSHAAIMIYIRKELLNRGFKGPKFKVANNGQLYIFEKKNV